MCGSLKIVFHISKNDSTQFGCFGWYRGSQNVLIAFYSMYVYMYTYIFISIYTYTENCIKPSAAIQDVLLLRECKYLSARRKYYKLFYIPFPQSLHMHCGNWTLLRCLFAPVGGENADQFFRVHEMNQGRLYLRNVAASRFSPECRMLW